MYCVNCGVKLQSGVEKCPLCNTPVWNPEREQKAPYYPERYPELKNENMNLAFILSALALIAEIVLLLVALTTTNGWNWGGIAMLGVAFGFIVFVLPLWFKHMIPYISIAIDHMALGGFLLYICCVTHGHWFMSFAFPITGISCLITTAMAVLLIHSKIDHFFLFGGAFALLGGFTMLIEFFEHITFQKPMFVWSICTISVFFSIGLFLILAGILKPLRNYLKKLFFF